MATLVQNDWTRRGSIVAAAGGCVFAVCLSLHPSGAAAQQPTAVAEAKVPVYDIVSIKPNKSASFNVSVNVNRDRYQGTNVSIKDLLEEAYGIKHDLISGVPGPIDSARFDVEAKVLEPDAATMKALSNKQRDSMMLPILLERFKVTAHIETKTLPVYELVVLKGGAKLQPTPDYKKDDDSTSIHNGELEAKGNSMESLAKTLTDRVHRTVIDKTGLTGGYDFKLKWDQNFGQQDDGSTESTAPSIFTALQEQLGLKLQPGKGRVETLVVDHVELPSEN